MQVDYPNLVSNDQAKGSAPHDQSHLLTRSNYDLLPHEHVSFVDKNALAFLLKISILCNPIRLPFLFKMGSIAVDNLRIASASGSVTDRRYGFADLAQNEDIHFIVGDWMSEYNMTTRGGGKVGSNGVSEEFETSFLEAFVPALPHLASRRIKVAVNAGASDTQKLYDIVVDKVREAGLNLKVAWVGGDEVFDVVSKAIDNGSDFKSLTTGMIQRAMHAISNSENMQESHCPSGRTNQYTLNVTSEVSELQKPSRMVRTLCSADVYLMPLQQSAARPITSAGLSRATASLLMHSLPATLSSAQRM